MFSATNVSDITLDPLFGERAHHGQQKILTAAKKLFSEPIYEPDDTLSMRIRYIEMPIYESPPETPIKEAIISIKPSKFEVYKIASIDKEVKLSLLQAERLQIHLLSLATNPLKLCHYLQPLELLLTQKLEERGISFSEEDSPQYLVSIQGCCLPTLPPTPLKAKGRVLNEAIWEIERSFGINKEGVPIFVGYIEPKIASEIIKAGYAFKEYIPISRNLLHGKNTHRLFILATMESFKGSEFADLSGQDLLQALIGIQCFARTRTVEKTVPLWDLVLDNIADHMNASSTDPLLHEYSCRSPFIMYALLLTAGKELGLKNLCHCMCQSHSKQIGKFLKNFNTPLSDEMHDVATMRFARLGDIGTLAIATNKELPDGDKYQPFKLYSHPNIKVKSRRFDNPECKEDPN